MPIESLVIGLSGEEIITDVLDQVEKALRTDCNLRATDSYGQGYSGKISIELKLLGLDATAVKVTAELAPTPEVAKIVAAKKEEIEAAVASGESTLEPSDLPAAEPAPVEANAEIDIPVESDLNAVRERSGQGIPFESTDTEGKPTTKRRRYVKSTAAAGGEAQEF